MKWISLKEQKPSKDQEVLAFDGENIWQCKFLTWPKPLYSEEWQTIPYDCCGTPYIENITHWMPLPPKPSKD